MKSSTKIALAVGAAVGSAVVTYQLFIRPWQHKWGAEPIDLKRPMPGDDIVDEPTDVTNRALTIEAEPADIWPWLVERRPDIAEGDVVPFGPNARMRVEELRPQRSVVLVPDDLPRGQASWSLMLFGFAPQRTRLIVRTRSKLGWSPSEAVYRMVFDPSRFVRLRKWLQQVRQKSEAAAAARRDKLRLEERRKPTRPGFQVKGNRSRGVTRPS